MVGGVGQGVEASDGNVRGGGYAKVRGHSLAGVGLSGINCERLLSAKSGQ